MVEAKLVTYLVDASQRVNSIGDTISRKSVIALYVQSEELLVRTNERRNYLRFHDPLDQQYEVLMGQQAQATYNGLLEQLVIDHAKSHSRIDPKEDTEVSDSYAAFVKSLYQKDIEVPDVFIAWAKSVHLAKNPPQEILDILPSRNGVILFQLQSETD